MANRYAGICRDCGNRVPKFGGNFHLAEIKGRFEVRCRSCINECNAARASDPALTYANWREAKRKYGN